MKDRRPLDRRRPSPAGLSFPVGLIGMLALTVAIESFSERRGREVMTTAAANYLLAGESARDEAPRHDVLCFGDSLVKFGLVPRMIEEATGLSTYNLAIVGGQPPASFSALRRALDAGAHPRAILVDFKPSILSVGSQYNAPILPELLTLVECVELGWRSRDAGFLARMALGRISPTYRRRLELREDLRAALRGGVAPVRDELLPLCRNWRVNRGALLLNKTPGMPEPQPGPADAPVFFPENWEVDRTGVRYLRRFLELARSRDIPVFWLMPPIRPDVQAKREALGLDARYDRLVGRFLDRFANVTVIDGRRAGYDPELFVDLSHLGSRGAALFSADVGSVLAVRLGVDRGPSGAPEGDRWATLPPFRDRAIEGPLENIRGSRIALGLEPPDGSQQR